jgi:hypothetical protein
MGVISDWLAASSQIQQSGFRVGKQRTIYRSLSKIISLYGDPARASTFDAINQLQTQAIHVATVDGGTFTLTFTLWSGETFTTGNIAFGANAATIEGAIDSAATSASIVGWTNGDISVAGGGLGSTPVTYTFDGTSVAGQNHDLIVVDDALLTGGGSAGAVVKTNVGQTIRYSWALLAGLNIITAGLPDQSDTPGALTVGAKASSNVMYPNQETLRAIALQAAIEDNNVLVGTKILDALGLAA